MSESGQAWKVAWAANRTRREQQEKRIAELSAELEAVCIDRDAQVDEVVALRAEVERLRTKLDLLTECLRPGLDEAPDGPATFLRAARKILGRPQSPA